MNVAYNEDCMEVMRRYPDKYFDLAVVDPPYGGGGGQIQPGSAGGLSVTQRVTRTGGGRMAQYGKKSHAGTMPLARTILQSFFA